MEERLEKAREYLTDLDAILFTGRINVAYLSGFTGSEGALFLSDTGAALFVDSRYTIQAKQETGIPVYEIVKRWEEIFEYVKGLGIKTMGIESHVMDFDTVCQIGEIFQGIEIKPMGKQFQALRSKKNMDEISKIQAAARISEEALSKVLDRGIIGRREKDVALDIEWEMRSLGASALAFDLIVASGPRSAMPHGVASEKVIGPNEPVIIDFGCMYEGYCSDQTVTIVTGTVDPDFAFVYTKLVAAQQKAIAGLTPGVKTVDVDAIARSYLDENGLVGCFGHGLGHGLGREVHEAPTISSHSEDILETGMVVTIEPGAYFPGKFGIRLEDCLAITDNSCQRMTNIAKGSIIKIS